MKVLILGCNGMLGPWLSEILKDDHEIIETDLEQIDTNTNFVKVDISDTDQVLEVAEGVDAIINLSVLRTDRRIAFDVNMKGNLNMMLAAEKFKISRIINTGPHFQVAGPTYENYDSEITLQTSTLVNFLVCISRFCCVHDEIAVDVSGM